MANLKSSKKDIRRTKRRTKINKRYFIELDKIIGKFKKDSSSKDSLSSRNKAYSVLDKMTSKGIIKKNNAARKKSKIAKASKDV